MSKFKFKLFRIILNIIAIIYFIFDEIFLYLSNKLTLVLSKIPKISEIKIKIDEFLLYLDKYVIFGLFICFLGISELLGIFSFIILAKGFIIPFIILYIVKFIPFFVMNYIFKVTKHKLLDIIWFKYCYLKVCQFTDYLKSTEIFIKVSELKVKIKNIISKFYDK